VKDIELNIVVGASAREECENKMHLLKKDFRGRIEAVGRELLAD
jgi:hypothetical protein